MTAYIVRRMLYSVPIVLGVLLLLFALFFLYADTEAMARKALGEKASVEVVNNWIRARGYDRPKFFNTKYGIIYFQVVQYFHEFPGCFLITVIKSSGRSNPEQIFGCFTCCQFISHNRDIQSICPQQPVFR